MSASDLARITITSAHPVSVEWLCRAISNMLRDHGFSNEIVQSADTKAAFDSRACVVIEAVVEDAEQ